MLWFIVMVLMMNYFWICVIYLPISFSIHSLALGQSCDCPSASEAILKDMHLSVKKYISLNAPVSYPTMLHFVKKCAYVCTLLLQNGANWWNVGYVSNASWDLWDGSISQYLTTAWQNSCEYFWTYCIPIIFDCDMPQCQLQPIANSRDALLSNMFSSRLQGWH